MPEQLVNYLMPLGFIIIIYLFGIRPQKKREKQAQEMRNALKVGDDIVTIGGIMGKITIIKEDFLTIEVGPTKTRLEITKWAVGSVISKNEA